MADFELLKELLAAGAAQGAAPTCHTFFEVIGRPHAEDLITRMLGHILGHNAALCAALSEFYSNNKSLGWDVSGASPKVVQCEKNMGRGRVDIFAETENFTLTVENKIYSFEHGDRTDAYCEFVFANCKNKDGHAFIYLKSDYNISVPHNKNFANGQKCRRRSPRFA